MNRDRLDKLSPAERWIGEAHTDEAAARYLASRRWSVVTGLAKKYTRLLGREFMPPPRGLTGLSFESCLPLVVAIRAEWSAANGDAACQPRPLAEPSLAHSTSGCLALHFDARMRQLLADACRQYAESADLHGGASAPSPLQRAMRQLAELLGDAARTIIYPAAKRLRPPGCTCIQFVDGYDHAFDCALVRP